MELYLLRGKAKATTSSLPVDPRNGVVGSTTITPKSSLASAHNDPLLDDDEVMLVKVKASPLKKNGMPRSFRQEAEDKSGRSLSDEENIPTHRNTAAVVVPVVVAAPVSPSPTPPVIDLTGSAHPSPAYVVPPPPPLATFYTMREFKEMWNMIEEDMNLSIEEIEQGSLVRSGNTKVAVRKNTDTHVGVQ